MMNKDFLTLVTQLQKHQKNRGCNRVTDKGVIRLHVVTKLYEYIPPPFKGGYSLCNRVTKHRYPTFRGL